MTHVCCSGYTAQATSAVRARLAALCHSLLCSDTQVVGILKSDSCLLLHVLCAGYICRAQQASLREPTCSCLLRCCNVAVAMTHPYCTALQPVCGNQLSHDQCTGAFTKPERHRRQVPRWYQVSCLPQAMPRMKHIHFALQSSREAPSAAASLLSQQAMLPSQQTQACWAELDGGAVDSCLTKASTQHCRSQDTCMHMAAYAHARV